MEKRNRCFLPMAAGWLHLPWQELGLDAPGAGALGVPGATVPGVLCDAVVPDAAPDDVPVSVQGWPQRKRRKRRHKVQKDKVGYSYQQP